MQLQEVLVWTRAATIEGSKSSDMDVTVYEVIRYADRRARIKPLRLGSKRAHAESSGHHGRLPARLGGLLRPFQVDDWHSRNAGYHSAIASLARFVYTAAQ